LSVLSVVLAVAFVLVPVRSSYGVRTLSGLGVLLAACATTLWLAHRAYLWTRTRRRPRDLWLSVVTTVAMLALLVVVAQPSAQYVHRGQCTFGPLGIGLGKVWIGVEPFPDNLHKHHALYVVWGAYSAQIIETLDEPTYFVFNKRDLRSPSADVTVEPPAVISCGRGSPPGGAPQVSLVGRVWRHRTSP